MVCVSKYFSLLSQAQLFPSHDKCGSGAAASAAESAQMMPTDFSFVGDSATHGLAAYNSTRSVDASVSLQKSQENVNKSIEGVNMAQKGLMESQTDMQKMTYKFAQDTYQNRLLQEQLYRDWETDRKSTRLNSSHITRARMPSSA